MLALVIRARSCAQHTEMPTESHPVLLAACFLLPELSLNQDGEDNELTASQALVPRGSDHGHGLRILLFSGRKTEFKLYLRTSLVFLLLGRRC